MKIRRIPDQGATTMTTPIRVAVTGAGGQIGYALLFRLASGAVFGPDQPVALQTAGNHPGPPRPQRHADGAGGLRLPAPGRHEGDRQGRGGVRRRRLGDPRRRPAPEGRHEPGRPDPGQRADLHRPGQGDQRRRRPERPGADRRQSLQHQLPDRPVARPQGARRPLVRHDPAGPEPGRLAARRARPACRWPRSRR